MAVPAIELKPRGPIALFDSAIRLCARQSGLWALTLPGGAAVTWAALRMADALDRSEPLLLPTAWFTLAWLFRGVCQASACHYLDGLLLGPTPPSLRASFKAALSRLPSVFITAAYLPLFTLVTLTLTAGIGFFFFASHLSGWAAMMKGKGHPLSLYGTCSRMLGPARGNAGGIRVLFASIVLFGLNVHLGANLLVYLGRKLAGLDLTFLQRFASLDNGDWMLVVVCLSFTAFEPLRAAVASLMLIDGRVRQEGLDLLAAVEQLPARGAPRSSSAAALMLAVVTVLGSFGAAHAQEESSTEPVHKEPPLIRISEAADACGYHGAWLDAPPETEKLSEADQEALVRLADDIELYAWDWEDCDAVVDRLEGALPELVAATQAAQEPSAEAARDRAKDILSRPEFTSAAPRADKPEAKQKGPEEDSAWDRFWKWLGEKLEDWFKRSAPGPSGSPTSGAGMGSANVVAVVVLAGGAAVIVVLLFLALRGRSAPKQAAEVEAESAGEGAQGAHLESALSRPPEGWAQLADELAAQGRFRDAVRSLYLALLSRLHRSGAIDYDPALSNWDYCRKFRGPREWSPAFRDLTARFDFAWYGEYDVGQQGYLAFRELTRPLLAPDAPGTERAHA